MNVLMFQMIYAGILQIEDLIVDFTRRDNNIMI